MAQKKDRRGANSSIVIPALIPIEIIKRVMNAFIVFWLILSLYSALYGIVH